ncbi:MAG TPA: TPM domain-containing protein [Candidatus Elarobacter sp.]|nr:TPM domain-containing protein [Candidatus Elarobacter sp.]
MKPQAALAAVTALTIALAATAAPAFAARSSYVVDDAQMLSPTAVSQLNQQIGDFNAQTGKEVVVVTTTSLNGTDPNAALERSFAQQQVNGVEIFIAKNDRQIKIAGDVASRRFFPSGSFNTIYQAMKPYFAQGNYDQGVETGVSLVINTYRGHTSSLNAGRQPVGAGTTRSVQRSSSSSGGFSMGWIWWLIILAVIFFIIRGIFRAIAGPRMYGPGGPGYGGPGYGGPGYGGPGYGYGGGGGGFWSGLLGGLGGAWLGNELFGGRNYGGGGAEGGSWAATGGADPGTSADAGGWQSDAGQIDTGNIGGGDWGGGGDSGGGWGGGDSGGGWGGGDSGGGGGDSGGGW